MSRCPPKSAVSRVTNHGGHEHGTPLRSSLRHGRSLAVKWREPDGQAFVGRLALGPATLHLVVGTLGAGGQTVDRQIGYAELQGLRIGSHVADRLDGRPALVIEMPMVLPVGDAGIGAPIVHGLVDRLSNLRLALG